MDKLAIEFEEELRSKMIEAKKTCGYNPTRFNQMLSRYGGVETARRLIANALKKGESGRGTFHTVGSQAFRLIYGSFCL